MSIYNKPHVPRPMGNGDAAEPDLTTTPVSPPSSSSSSPSRPQQGHKGHTDTGPSPSSSTNSPDTKSTPNISSTSIAPSTAEGKAIPLADTTAAQPTSALQKLNSTYPSADPRHRYAKSSGAQNSTYSQPVIVRTYSGPSSSQGLQSSRSVHSSRHRTSSTGRGLSRRVPLTSGSGGLSSRLSQPELSSVGVGIGSSRIDRSDSSSVGNSFTGNVPGVNNMPRHHKSKKSSGSSTGSKLPIPWQWIPAALHQEEEETKLPPVDAFSFKSFMADIQTRNGENDIGADLDRIAEICARSRYSLSNQYEVHVAPHGSGASFVAGRGSSSTPRRKKGGMSQAAQGMTGGGGLTLQAVTSDDEEGSSHSRHRRRNGGRRRSAAYGTLETIMSSSRSSEEDKSKKKPAADIAGEVRGRAARKAWDMYGSASMSASTGNGGGSNGAQTGQDRTSKTAGAAPGRLARKKSASFANAIMKNDVVSSSSSSQQQGRRRASSSVASALLSEPALPQTSNNHLGVRAAAASGRGNNTPAVSSQPREVYYELPHQTSEPPVVDGWSSWIPWRSSSGNDDGAGQYHHAQPGTTSSHAEGRLRQLLRSPPGEVPGQGAHY
ncbi:hypothetical protein QBC35DRAFT_513917 [Podospora australis]|uniref:Uncharacterized protein n=1 Tax=Podospora australis TaxID=1536484 RepID=A0AAN6WWQ9_9PEZI|nr:hypothetical protein QBC35DRAFT_513917 [Podospora australis]